MSLENTHKKLTPELYVQIARMHESKGDFVGAIKQYEQALKVSPGNTDVLVGLGRAYDRSGNIAKAIESYERAIKADPRCALAYNDLGLCLARQNDLARSHDCLSRAVALVPTSKLYRNNLATVCVEMKQYPQAYEQLSAVHPPAIAHYNLGILANRRGDKVEAMSRFQQASAADPNLAQARRMIDKLNGVTQVASQPTISAPNFQEQAKQFQSQLGNQANQFQGQVVEQAKQYSAEWQQQARQAQSQVAEQAQQQYEQVKSQVDEAQTDLASRAQTGVDQLQTQAGQQATQYSEKAQAAARDAEAKIRAAMGPYFVPTQPTYGSSWVPEQDDDITPIQAETPQADSAADSDPPTDVERYNISDEEDDTPTLLPPTE